MKALTIILTGGLLVCFSTFGFSQDKNKRKHRFPVWTFHEKNTNTYGLSLGIATPTDTVLNTNTYGVKVELFGWGGLLPMAPRYPFAMSDSGYHKKMEELRHEKINGVALAGTGSWCHCQLNGITAGGIGQYYVGLNGIGFAPFMLSERTNGILIGGFTASNYFNGLQVAFMSNSTAKGRGVMVGLFNFGEDFSGLQIGLVNLSEKGKGLQFGLWNKNEKRGFPIINWNFND